MRSSRRKISPAAAGSRQTPPQIGARAEPESAELEPSVIDVVGALIIILDPEGRIRRFNPACERLTGYREAELLNRTFFDILLPPEDVAGVREVFANLRAGQFPNTHTNGWLTRSGEIRHIVWSNTAVVDPATGLVTRVIGTGLDITSQKAAEAALREAHRDLEARVEERTAEVLQQQQALVHLGRLNSLGELAAALAHELNQPLSATLTNAESALIALQNPHVSMDSLRDTLMDIARDACRAGEVIQRMRGLSRREDAVREDVDVRDVLRDVAILMRHEAERRGVNVNWEPVAEALPARGDSVQLTQVLVNLVLNACDALAAIPKKRRRVRIAAGREPDGAVKICVRDSGPGIPPDAMERIFDFFHTSKQDGLGLGLSISRSIARAHGGRLWAENAPDGGARFCFELPPVTSRGAEARDE